MVDENEVSDEELAHVKATTRPARQEGTEGLPLDQQDEVVFAEDPSYGRGIIPPYVGPEDGASPENYDEIEDDR